MYRLTQCANTTSTTTWSWKITETDQGGETKEVAYFRERDLADAVCKLLNMAATVVANDPSML